MRLNNPLSSPIRGPVHGLFTDMLRYPDGAILYYDANTDAYTEQTYGPHTFNSSILSPQYQLNADGSYTDVGAKPGVDVFDGKKFLRSCGAVTNENLVADYIALPWFADSHSIVAGGVLDGRSAVKVTTIAGIATYKRHTYQISFTGTKTYSFVLQRGNQDVYLWRASSNATDGFITISFATKTAVATNGTSATYTGVTFESIDNDSAKITLRVTATSAYQSPGICCNTSEVGKWYRISAYHISPAAYPVPYVPPGVTQPASNATTTNGSWFTLPDGSPVWKALTGQPLTLAARVRMGVGSDDLPLSSFSNHVIQCLAGNAPRISAFEKGATGNSNPSVAHDGTTPNSSRLSAYPRNAIIRRVTQVNTAGTQFRVGYMIEGTHTAIQWSAWVNYDSSFNPSTLYRLMLGYANAYPMWFNKIAVWNKQMDDAAILEALS